MRRAFLSAPPSLARASLTRPRLIRSLRGRWEHRVTLLTGGAGLGKTTLLVQAVHENQLAPRGRDLWLGLEAADSDGARLEADLVDAVGARVVDDPIEAVAAGVWAMAPSPVCLVLDDLHLLATGSRGLAVVDRLIDLLPSNGHVLIASRTRPPLRLARLAASGELLELPERALLLTEQELKEFAELRGVEPALLVETGGWPALAELVSRAGSRLAGDFVWEEVIEPLGRARRHVLAVLCDLGGADEALASAAIGHRVDLAEEVGRIPLVTAGATGWYQPHPLWSSVAALQLAPDERARVRRAAIAHLLAAGRYEEGFDLLADAGLWDLAPGVLRRACLVGSRPVLSRLDAWLKLCPDSVRSTAGGLLAVGVRSEMADAANADAPLTVATSAFRAEGDLEDEIAAITHLGRVAWWREDLGTLATLAPRVSELAATGHRAAIALDRIGRALVADLQGSDDGIWNALVDLRESSGDPWWDAVIAWLRSLVLASRGDPVAAMAVLDAIDDIDDPVFGQVLESARATFRWSLGEIEWAVRTGPELHETVEATGVAQNIVLSAAGIAYSLAHVGRSDEAVPFLERAKTRMNDARANAVVMTRLAEASIQLAGNDAASASRTLRAAIEEHPIEQSTPRRRWRQALALTYVLVPEVRSEWDAADLAGQHRLARDLARAVVAGRGGQAFGASAPLDLSDLGAVRASLHVRLAAELAVVLHSEGRPEGALLLETLGSAGRTATRDLALAAAPGTVGLAPRLLAAVPAPPALPLAIAALGPLELRSSDRPVDPPELRRERVRALLAYLLAHKSVSRESVIGALWPDRDERAAANNLRVNLSHLLRALEPGRPENEPAYHIRTDGGRLRLVTDGLRIDVDAFDECLRAAQQAEADATPSLALPHYEAAVALYRGDLYADVSEAEWFALDRERYRTRFGHAAVRAAQLLLVSGGLDQAEDLAKRALARDPWSEAACGVLVGAALARGDRSGAHHLLQRCHEIASELGVEASGETRRLQRLLRSGSREAAPSGAAVAMRPGSGAAKSGDTERV